MKKLTALLLSALMLLALASACGGNETPTPIDPPPVSDSTEPPASAAPPAEEELKIYYTYLTSDADTLDGGASVQEANDTPIQWCSSSLYRAVPSENGKGYEFIPDLAEAMPEQVDDYTWRVTLRQEAKWHNGDPINADTMIFTYKTLLDPVAVKPMANFLADGNITIVNAVAYQLQGTEEYPDAVAWEDVGIKKIDDRTIEFKVESKVDETSFCTHFTIRALFPIHEELYKSCLSDDGLTSTYGTTLDTWMGCGPYTFDQWEYDSIHIYHKNEDHWLADYFNFDEVQVRIVPEMNARLELFESGQLDSLSPDANTIETYIDDPRMVSYPSVMVLHYDVNAYNENNPLCGSLNYRKALYHAIDREIIAEDIYGHMEPTGTYVNGMAGMLSESGLAYRDSEYGKEVWDMIEEWGPYGYNPELALDYLKKAYAECGVSDDTVITLKWLYTESGAEEGRACEWAMSAFPEIFEGRIQVEPQIIASGMSLDYMVTNINDWDITMMDWGRSLSRTLPYQCYYYFLSTYSGHPNNYFDDEFEAQFAACEAVKEGAYETILEETMKLEKIHLDKVVNIPFCQMVNYELFSDRLELPVDNYIPGFGWGTMFADVAE